MTSHPIRHHHLEDVAAIIVGGILIAFGLAILHSAGFVTGGMAGLALLSGHFIPLPTGVVFAVLNVPFLVLSLRALGATFTSRTVGGSVVIAFLSTAVETTTVIRTHDPLIAAVGAGSMLGLGALIFIRHGTGLGGVGILAIWLNQNQKWNLGFVQMGLDILILGGSAVVIAPDRLAWSALSAVSMGTVVSLWHKSGRYTGVSYGQ